MNLSITRNGKKEPYSESQFRLDNPSVSFPRGLAGVDLAAYGVEVEPELEKAKEEPQVVEKIVERVVKEVKVVPRTVPPDPTMVPMHCFLYGIRQFGLRVQAERYFLAQQGHARDYWQTCPYVSRASTYVKHFAKFFMLKEVDIDVIFATANGIEE
jgi:hypothetical protein